MFHNCQIDATNHIKLQPYKGKNGKVTADEYLK